ncbi:regulator of G-protein signaling [Acrasis kona]|uniref:Regulator of G-protein signaling n=1 Tax=Acrasis kona TaxID=1008807 RepID=A0AAW2ZLX6_9EUKA
MKIQYQDYEVLFENIFEERGIQENYRRYLDKSYQLEPLLFLLEVRLFRKNPTLQHAKEIINKFIRNNAEYELNLSNNDRLPIIEFGDNATTTPPENLFQPIHNIVFAELRSDSFHRYLNSEIFKEYINKKGEQYLNSISKKIFNCKKPKILPGDFSVPYITDQDVENWIRMNDCVSDWLSVRPTAKDQKERDYYPYVSKNSYLLTELNGKSSSQLITKLTGRLNYSAEHVTMCLFDERNKHYWMDYASIYEHKGINTEHEYMHVNVYSDILLSKFLSARDNLNMSSLLYDTERRCYMWVTKSDLINDKKQYRKSKSISDGIQLNCMFIYETGENTCRYCYLLFGEFGLKSMDFVHRLIAKKLSKKMHNQFIQMCSITPSRDGDMLNTLYDFRKKHLSEPNSIKTWADDLLVNVK